jgi:RNAse (barnase) inhibitor barstar
MDRMGNNPESWKQLGDDKIDLNIMGKGFINLYYKEDVLDYDIELLKKKYYKIIEFDGNYLTTENELHFDLQDKLNFPDYYGKNWNALIDCLIDYEIDENGVTLVFRHLNNLDLTTTQNLLDIFADRARRKFIAGKKLLTLVQVDDPKFKIVQPIGAINRYLWNDKEWFEAGRL